MTDQKVVEQIEVQAKYHGYIERQEAEIARIKGQEEALLPENLDYHTVTGLSNEVCQKLSASRPVSLGQASRIPGITPAAISLLLIPSKEKSPCEPCRAQTGLKAEH